MIATIRWRAVLLPAIVLAVILAALFLSLHRYSTTSNIRPIQSNYEGGPAGAVPTAGVPRAVTQAATFTG